MIVIDGPLWFMATIVVVGLHVIYLRGWRRERRQHLAWWRTYDADAQRRHEEFMQVMKNDRGTSGWALDGSRTRGQA